VRILVPFLGENWSMRLGLIAFSIQCVIVAFSTSPVWIFVSVLFSMLANLVYPSISSLVSKIVNEEAQGEALGALNGIKAVTEGFGPLIFGLLMSLFEDTPLPGAPYLVAAFISIWAFLHCFELPPEPDAEIDYVKHHSNVSYPSASSSSRKSSTGLGKWLASFQTTRNPGRSEEGQHLLSESDTESDDGR
jgi:MFS family permease